MSDLPKLKDLRQRSSSQSSDLPAPPELSTNQRLPRLFVPSLPSLRDIALILALATGVGLAVWSIESKVSADRALALSAYRNSYLQSAHEAGKHIDEKFRQVQQNLRMISMLPSVRELDRHAANLSAPSRVTIQEIYNNLASNVDVSEVYIVPVSFDPARMDEVTGRLEEPTLMFDELITTADREDDEDGSASPSKEAEIETFEYAVLTRQLAWLKQHYPDASIYKGIARPMVSSEAVITCDNSAFALTGRDSDRMGMVLSVPFYGADNKLKGVVSAILRSAALASYLPKTNAALVNPVHHFVALSPNQAPPAGSMDHILHGQQDPALLFSSATEIDSGDPQSKWIFWTGLPNSTFNAGADVRSIEAFRLTAYVILGSLLAGLIAATAYLRSRHQRLKREMEARDDQIAVLERAKAETSAARQAAEHARLVAEAANRAKSEFLANMSHEIRTPLNGVLGVAQALSSDTLTQAQRDQVSLILESGKSLTSLLGDILDLSKIEAGKLDIAMAPGDVARSIERVVDLFRPQAEAKALELQLEVREPFPKHLICDDHRLRQCVANLVSNAIKFTSSGVVCVTLAARAMGGDQYRVVIQVTDTGIGMSQDALSRLFTPFAQADNSTTRRYGGTGLGLAISQRLARMMDGDIRVHSEEGRGSSFALILKARVGPPVLVSTTPLERLSLQTPPASLTGLRVLLTDDNTLNRKIIRLLLEPQGCLITEAVHGADALDKLASLPFDIVLLDAHMPVMDGPEAVRSIRASTASWRNIPVIALTADAMSGDREKYLAMGMSEYLSKPVDKADLIAKIKSCLAGSPAKPQIAI